MSLKYTVLFNGENVALKYTEVKLYIFSDTSSVINDSFMIFMYRIFSLIDNSFIILMNCIFNAKRSYIFSDGTVYFQHSRTVYF